MKDERKAKGSPAQRSRARGAGLAGRHSPDGASRSQSGSPGIQPAGMSLTRMLEELKPHDHLCLIYESPEEWRAAAVPFIAIGLKRGEKCLYIMDTSTADEIYRYLAEEGIDVAMAERSGQLSMLHEAEAYTREGSFDPDRMIALLISETEKALAEGHPALRVTGEMTWVLSGHPGSEKLLEYEGKLNRDFLPRYPCLALCQYDRWKFDPEIIRGVVITHPLLIRGNQIYRNFYYIPFEEFLSEKRTAVEVQRWLNSLEREHQVQMTLHQSEEKYRALTEQSVTGIVVVQDFRIVYANAAFSEISGYSIEELLSLPPEKVQAMVHPDDRALVWGRFRDRLAGKPVPPHYEYRGIRKDGSVRWLEMHATRIEYGGKPAIQGAIVDITKRKGAEAALRESEERYRSLVEAANEGISVVQDGVIKLANPKIADITGYSIDELKSIDAFKLIHPDDREKIRGYHAQRMKGEEVPSAYQLRVIDREGNVKWLQRSAVTITWEGKPAALVIDTDITERKRLEEQVRAERAQLLSIFDSMSEAIYVTDPVTYEILYANKAIKDMFQKPLVGGICYREFQNRQSPCEFCTNDIILKLKGEPYQWEYFNPVLKRHFLLTDRIIKWPDGRDVRFEFAMDITQRKQAEEKLWHLNLVLRAIRNINQLITRGADRDALLKGACRTFVQTRGYASAWIALLDESCKLITATQAGLGNRFQQLAERLKRGELPYCAGQALKKPGAVVIQVTSSECADCPLAVEHGDVARMVVGLEYGGKVRGVIAVYLQPTMAVEKEEQELFKEVAGDIAHALTKMELEEALRRSEERYRTILEDLAEGYYEQDLAGNFTLVNNAMCHLLGYSREELIGMGYRVYTPEDDVGRRYEIWNRVYRTGEPVKFVLLENIRKDGTRIYVEDSFFPLRNKEGTIIGFRGISRDITQRKLMEEALRASEEKYRQLVENANEAIVVAQDWMLKFANRRTSELTGYSNEELTSIPFAQLIHPDDRDMVVERHLKRLAGEVVPAVYSFRYLTKDGRVGWLDISAVRIEWEGRPATLNFLTDVTERKRLEEERRQLELKAQVASRLTSVGEMTAGIAHEINNPLTGIIGYAQLLMDRKDIPFDVRRDLMAINEGAQRVADIVKRLLAFSRQVKPERKLVHINEVIESTLLLRDYHLRTNNIQVIKKLDPHLPETVADPGQIQQVLLNLIVNAETEMRLAHGRGKLTITTEGIDNKIRIKVKDDGPGIKPEIMDRIFEPFFTTREVGEGTGLGLSLCYGMVKEHNGNIYAESTPGKGATFIVELPIVTESEAQKPSQPVEEQPEKPLKARILVVDDEKVITELVKRVLSREGYEVDTVNKAAEALEMIKKQRYHLILLDIKMPGMDGVELYRRIEDIAKSLARRVIFITGDVMAADTEKFISGTRSLRLDKPFTAEQLRKVVRSALSANL